MKTGRSLTALAQEIERQANEKRDFVASTQSINLLPALPESGTDGFRLALGRGGEDRIDGETGVEMFGATDTFHGQLASYAGIPKAYYDTMRREAPELLTKNVNHWLHVKPQPRMVRTLDGNARAFLSDRYRALDNFELLQAILPEFTEHTGLEIVSCEVTAQRMYVKALSPRIRGEVKPGDEVQAGIVISNSEVGAGSLRVEPLVYRLVCLNGLITNAAMRKYHVGRKQLESEEAIQELLSTRTRELADSAFFATVRDVVRGSLQQDVFDRNVARLLEASGRPINGDPIKTVELTRKKFSLTEGEGSQILQHLIRGGDLSQWGLANAVTRSAQDVPDYDRATAFERLGGEIIELAPRDWSVLAEAA